MFDSAKGSNAPPRRSRHEREARAGIALDEVTAGGTVSTALWRKLPPPAWPLQLRLGPLEPAQIESEASLERPDQAGFFSASSR
jgi:hypothetical protein